MATCFIRFFLNNYLLIIENVLSQVLAFKHEIMLQRIAISKILTQFIQQFN